MKKISSILDQFEKQKDLYDDFRQKSESLVKELLIVNNLHFHLITSRLKIKEKIEEKIKIKEEKYGDLSDITDVAGIRIITYFEDEVDRIANIIEKEFIVDKDNSIDKRKLEIDRFGYKSLHYVVSINDKRIQLIEYTRFKNLKIEIQIRSILQHAWAEIEHDIGYKGEILIPQALRRVFHRVAALLETTDIEFVNIKNKLETYKIEVEKQLKGEELDIKIDKVSITSFITNDPIVKKIDNQIVKNSKRKLRKDFNVYSQDLERLKFLNIDNISKLKKLLVTHEQKLVKLADYWLGSVAQGGFFVPGISIFYLCYYLLGLSNDREKILKYFTNCIFTLKTTEIEINADKLLGIMEKLKE